MVLENRGSTAWGPLAFVSDSSQQKEGWTTTAVAIGEGYISHLDRTFQLHKIIVDRVYENILFENLFASCLVVKLTKIKNTADYTSILVSFYRVFFLLFVENVFGVSVDINSSKYTFLK